MGTYAYDEDSDQSAFPRMLIWVLADANSLEYD